MNENSFAGVARGGKGLILVGGKFSWGIFLALKELKCWYGEGGLLLAGEEFECEYWKGEEKYEET